MFECIQISQSNHQSFGHSYSSVLLVGSNRFLQRKAQAWQADLSCSLTYFLDRRSQANEFCISKTLVQLKV